MRVLGIDCGTEYTGYGVVEQAEDGRLSCQAVGAIRLNSREPLPKRLNSIFCRLRELIQEHRPDDVAIEDVFYAVNVKSALKLGQRSEEHTSELQSRRDLVCRLLLE